MIHRSVLKWLEKKNILVKNKINNNNQPNPKEKFGNASRKPGELFLKTTIK